MNSTNKLILPFFIIISLVFAQCGSKKKENDLTLDHLEGKIKSVKTLEYIADSASGKPLKDKLVFKDEWSYNENGLKTNGTTYQILASDTLSYKTAYKYDDKNRKISWTQFEMDGTVSFKFTYTYDENGNNTEESRFGSDGALEYTIVHTFNENNQITEDNTINSSGGFNYKAKRKYDSAGNNTEMSYYHANNVFDYKVEYVYNDKGNVIQETGYRSKGGLNYVSKLTYDENNNLLEKCDYNSKNVVKWRFIHKYEKFDANKNWLLQTLSKDGKPISYIEREIGYF